MVLNATFNNISVISWRSVFLVEEDGVSVKTTDLSKVTDTKNMNYYMAFPILALVSARDSHIKLDSEG
jgi:hypothetical protein